MAIYLSSINHFTKIYSLRESLSIFYEVFHSLYCVASGDINVHDHLATMEGELSLIFRHGNLHIDDEVHIRASGGDLIVRSEDGLIAAQLPFRLETTENLQIDRRVQIRRTDGSHGRASIVARKALNITNVVELHNLSKGN